MDVNDSTDEATTTRAKESYIIKGVKKKGEEGEKKGKREKRKEGKKGRESCRWKKRETQSGRVQRGREGRRVVVELGLV